MEINRFYHIINHIRLKKEVIVNDNREIANYSLPDDVITRISIIDAPIIYPDGKVDNWVMLKEDGFTPTLKRISELSDNDFIDTLKRILSSSPITAEIYHQRIREYFENFTEAMKEYSNIHASFEETEDFTQYTKSGDIHQFTPGKYFIKVGEFPIIEICKSLDESRGRFYSYTYDKDYENEGNLLPLKHSDTCVGMKKEEIIPFIDKYVNLLINGKDYQAVEDYKKKKEEEANTEESAEEEIIEEGEIDNNDGE